MKFELKKVHECKSLSEETPAYTAQVWVDGVHVCDVSNDGHGGCDYQYPAKGKTTADVAALNNLIKSTYPKQTYTMGGEEHSYDTDLEVLCHRELDRLDLIKIVKRDLKSKCMFTKKDGKIYSISLKKFTLDQVRAHLKSKGEVVAILNDIPLDDAVAIYLKQSGE